MVAVPANSLIKKLGDKAAVSTPDLCFPSSEIIGLAGNNGAGKTAFFRLILNLIKVDGGIVNFCLTDESTQQDKANLNGNMTLVPHLEDAWKSYIAAYPDESFLIEFLAPKGFFTFIAKVNNIGEQEMEGGLNSLQSLLGNDILGRKVYIRELSAGDKQKVGIVATLLSCPKFAILDEPFNFLDPSSQNHLKKLLIEYKTEHKASILISSHNPHHTTDISNRIVLMEKGGIIKNIDDITEESVKELENYFLQRP